MPRKAPNPLRRALCEALGLAKDDTPFAGELLQERDDERDWEGAAERLLHGFGLSLLVPDARYRRVAEWVDRVHLRGRLVYFHVRPVRRGELPGRHRNSLVRKLSIKPDSPFYDWLERELAQGVGIPPRRPDSPEGFRRFPGAGLAQRRDGHRRAEPRTGTTGGGFRPVAATDEASRRGPSVTCEN